MLAGTVTCRYSNFVSADHGWLCLLDGKESAQVLLKLGKKNNTYKADRWGLKDAKVHVSRGQKLGCEHHSCMVRMASQIKSFDAWLTCTFPMTISTFQQT